MHEQCTFVDESGHRCPARTFLQLDHIDSRALGGSSEASNLRVLCRAHNHLHAEQVFGERHVAERIHFRQRKLPVDRPPDASRGDDSFDQVKRGLVNMGFRERDAVNALDIVYARRREGPAPPIHEILREALRVLT